MNYELYLDNLTDGQLQELRELGVLTQAELSEELRRRNSSWLGRSSTWTAEDSRRISQYVGTKVDLDSGE